MSALKYLVVLTALVWSASGYLEPESAKLQHLKAKNLAPYNGGAGVSCSRNDPTKADTCMFQGSFCGYFCECPKCICLEENYVAVEKSDGTRECMEGNIDHGATYDTGTSSWRATAGSSACQVDAQCRSNLQCAEILDSTGATIVKRCICPDNYQWDPDNSQACVPPYVASDATNGVKCDTTVGCKARTSTETGYFCDSASRDCKACTDSTGATGSNPDCAVCSKDQDCDSCKDGYRKGANNKCEQCTAPNCKRCPTAADECDTCSDGFFKDSTNLYACTAKVNYGMPCKGENNECETSGAECRSVDGVNVCTCKAGYTWNPSGSFCVHPEANLNVEVNRTCRYDRKNLNLAKGFNNDDTLQVCRQGLECVDSCSPCAGCDSGTGSKVCVTRLDYTTPPCWDQQMKSNSGSGSGSSTSNNNNNSNNNSAAGRSVTSKVAIFASIAMAALFW